jgi:hypothetical protein
VDGCTLVIIDGIAIVALMVALAVMVAGFEGPLTD